jgi:hypothetical protein
LIETVAWCAGLRPAHRPSRGELYIAQQERERHKPVSFHQHEYIVVR